MKLLIVENIRDGGFRALTNAHIEILKRAHPGVQIIATEDPTEIAKHMKDIEAVAGYPGKLPVAQFLGAANLKWVHSFSARVDRILTSDVINSSLLVSNSSGIHAVPIAEHILGFLLIWTRRFHMTFRNQEAHRWEKLMDITELRGKTVFIVGLGAIGEEAAQLCHAFGTRVIASVRREREKPDFIEELVVGNALDEALPEADFVVVCLPYSRATHHRFGAAQFAKMKPSAAIVNIGRGNIIDEAALITALENKTIAGALLDVTAEEPLPPESPLWDMENVMITPHHSGLSEKYMDRAIDRLALNLAAYVKGEKLPNQVDKQAGY